MSHRWIALRLFAAMVAACACEPPETPPRPDGGPEPVPVSLARPTRSTTLAVSRDGKSRAVVNPDLGRLVVERAGTFNTHFVFAVGSWPSSIALHPVRDVAFVTLRKERSLAIVEDVWNRPRLGMSLQVCSEPTGVALTPNGRFAVVACFGEPLAVIVDTATLTLLPVPLAGVARAVAITNDGDDDDFDEHAYVTLFYGSPVMEGSDLGRVGKVVEIDLRRRVVSAQIALNPVADTGFGPTLPDGGEGPHVACAPNQLAAIAIAGLRAFVVHQCVSPEAPLQPLTSLSSVVSEIDLHLGREIRSVALGKLVREQGTPGESLLGLPVDIDVDRDGRHAVVLSQAANRVVRVSVAPGTPLSLERDAAGSTSTPIPAAVGPSGPCGYAGCVDSGDARSLAAGVPLSVALADDGTISVNDWTAAALIDVGQRTFAYGPPVVQPREMAVLKGRRFFYTGQDRWSLRDVGSCASCHPDGLSDNITWVFGSGPRQSTPLDGTYAKGNATDHRAQNWTAIFDEIQDVEGVTRNLLGGKGAICRGPLPFDVPIALNVAMPIDAGVYIRNDNLSGSTRFVVDRYANLQDWNEIDEFVQDVHANRAPLKRDLAALQRGREVFAAGGCPSCHGGPKWTVSRIPYAPSPEKNGSAIGDKGTHPLVPTGLRTQLRAGHVHPLNRDTYKVAPERVPNPAGGAELTIGPERITCVLRDVGTFDPADPLEKKADGSRAQGALGFNPPSLLGLATSAPYFHAGAARTLADVFSARFAAHTQAGRPGFQPQGQELTDLIEFLRSIDESTQPFTIADTSDVCGDY